MPSNRALRSRLVCGAALLASLWAGQALAQDTDTTSVEELVVTAPNYVPTTNTAATKIAIPLIETRRSRSR